MQTITLNFNHEEDEGLPTSGTVTVANDFNVNDISEISIRGLGEWRDGVNLPKNLIGVNERMLNNILTPTRLAKFEGTDIAILPMKANHDILIPSYIRKKGVEATNKLLAKFFKTLSSAAKVTLETQASDEDTSS